MHWVQVHENCYIHNCTKTGQKWQYKKSIVLKIDGGAHTEELIERLRLKTDSSGCVAISIVAEPEREVVESEKRIFENCEKDDEIGPDMCYDLKID